MKFVGSLLRNRNFILLLAIVLGLSLGDPLAGWISSSILPLLALVMTLSAINVTSRELATLKDLPRFVGLSLLLNYVVMGGVTLLLAWWLIDDSQLWAGFVLLACVPPAVGVVPFSYIARFDPVRGAATATSIITTQQYLLEAVLLYCILSPAGPQSPTTTEI